LTPALPRDAAVWHREGINPSPPKVPARPMEVRSDRTPQPERGSLKLELPRDTGAVDNPHPLGV
jgi:hypothetical protein